MAWSLTTHEYRPTGIKWFSEDFVTMNVKVHRKWEDLAEEQAPFHVGKEPMSSGDGTGKISLCL